MYKKTKGTIAITLAIAAMVLIFVSSSMSYKDQSLVATIQKGLPSQPFSELLSKIKFEYAGQTISIPSLGYAQFVEFFIRKITHFLAYFFIGYQWTRGLSVHVRKKGFPQFLAFFITVLYAITDEFHQGITPGRTPLIQDVFIDALGAMFGVGLGTLKKIK